MKANSSELEARRALDEYKVDCVKNYITHIENLIRGTRAAAMELERLMGKLEPGGIAYDSIRVTTSPTGDALERGVLELMERREALAREQLLGLEQIDAFWGRLKQLNTEGGVIVRLHYFEGIGDDGSERYGLNGPSYQAIGEPLGYSKTTAFRKRDAGYVELYDNGIPREFAPVEMAI